MITNIACHILHPTHALFSNSLHIFLSLSLSFSINIPYISLEPSYCQSLYLVLILLFKLFIHINIIITMCYLCVCVSVYLCTVFRNAKKINYHPTHTTHYHQLKYGRNKQSQVQSVIQANQSSVIQTAANLQPLLGKGVLYVNKGNSVIHSAPGNFFDANFCFY